MINIRQFTILVLFFTTGSSILFAPSVLIGMAEQDGWIAGLLAFSLSLLMVCLYGYLNKKISNAGLIEAMLTGFGPFFGSFFTIQYLFYFFILSALALNDMGVFMLTEITPETPIYAIYLIFMLVILLAITYGIESLARTAELFLPGVLTLLILLFLFLLPEVKLDEMLPMLENDMKSILHATLNFFAFPFLELIVLLSITPFVHNNKKVTKALMIGTAIGGFILLLFTFFAIWVMGPGETGSVNFPSYRLAQHIVIGNIATRVEVVIAVIWVISLFIKLTLCFFALLQGIKQILGMQSIHALRFPIAMLLIVLSPVMFPNYTYLLFFTQEIFWAYSSTYGIIIPLLLLIAMSWKQGKNGEEEGETGKKDVRIE
ncbi:GerAB/ArcD/ProY family transporter [Rubeoparvulum massiliense]|uniref:GerAB/ArcD/ProY family transporter n=1 Tax=Rubeoparvulum massiliense TaxID=1631346 RepID=UPI00065DFC12|nr:endospore germination permease [Rubeoparvulum massiliense]